MTLRDCPPGPFYWHQDGGIHYGFKSEYGDNNGHIDAYNEAGEYVNKSIDVTPFDFRDLFAPRTRPAAKPELAEEVLALLRAGGCNAGDAREVLALVACQIQEKEARAGL